MRLDLFLAARCPDLSRNQIQQALAAGLATVDGAVRPKNHRLHAGSVIRLEPPARAPQRAIAQDLPLAVVHADADLLVIDKAAGQVVHPAPGHPDGTIVNAVLHRCGTLAGPAGRAAKALAPHSISARDKRELFIFYPSFSAQQCPRPNPVPR